LNKEVWFIKMEGQAAIEPFVGEVLKVSDMPGSLFGEKLKVYGALSGFEHSAANF
jgi:hypothetical protein